MTKEKATLTPELEELLDAAVAEGRFADRQEALTQAVRSLGTDADLAWAKPYIDAGLASLERGEGIPADEVDAQMKDYFARRR